MRKKYLTINLLIIFIALSSFYPGLQGSFLFDDTANIVKNTSLHIQNMTLENLAYGTVQENVNDAFSHIGNYAEGERNNMAVLTEKDIPEIRRLYAEGKTPTEIAKNYPGITPEAIGMAARRKTWRHIQ